jgi:integrase
MKRKPLPGSFNLVMQPKAKARWKVPGVFECEPNWIVRFNVPGQKVKAESSQIPICDSCLADRRAERPLREGCLCRGPALRWAETKLRIMVTLWQNNRLADLERVLQPKARLTFAPVFEVYSSCKLPSRMDNLNALRQLLEAPSGRPAESVYLDELTPEWVRRFASLYQEYGRRGWSIRQGRATEDEDSTGVTEQRWAQLRAMMPVPALDWDTAAKWNTTINSRVRSAKSVLGPLSREKYLLPIAGEMPELKEFLGMHLSLPALDSREGFSGAVFGAMMEEMAKLRGVNTRLWAALQLAYETGMRPIEMKAARTNWLEVDEAGTVLMVVRNRPEENFWLKAKHSNRVRALPLSGDLVQVITELTGGREAVGVFGLVNEHQLYLLMQAANAWIARYVGTDSTHKLYRFRKLRATAMSRVHGGKAGADALGHENESMTRQHYISPEAVVKSMSDAEVRGALAPERRPWKPGNVIPMPAVA